MEHDTPAPQCYAMALLHAKGLPVHSRDAQMAHQEPLHLHQPRRTCPSAHASPWLTPPLCDP